MTPLRRPLPPPERVVEFLVESSPRLVVVVDTEEEFDWSAPFSRDNTSVSAIRHLGRGQRIFERYGLCPTYVVDYCVAHQPQGYEPLLPIAAENRCTIGAHLHPWINPPFSETISGRNSFACNLDTSLECEKLMVLRDEIEHRFGSRPRVYKAGRYGIDNETVETLAALGFVVDTSVNPTMDFSDIEGPSFAAFGPEPFWQNSTTAPLLFLPCTVGFIGALPQRVGRLLHGSASHPSLRQLRGVGVLTRLGLVNKVMLSPEGNALDEMMALARRLTADGVRTFSLSFHSPSLWPGHTPYVRTASELDAFLATVDRFCEFFFRELGGEPATPLSFYGDLAGERQ